MQDRLNTLRMIGASCLLLLTIRWHSGNVKAGGFRATFLLLGGVLLYLQLTYPFSELYPFFYALHMLDMSLMYFVIPPFILLGIPSIKSHVDVPFLRQSPKISLTIFAIFFTMEHHPLGRLVNGSLKNLVKPQHAVKCLV
ncbi:MAG: cytochrome c oxidase assembly protein [Bacillaceae bacterium]|nr:cytochrome c oxidase assembly protein [Bacillaceae bacterium]